MASKRRAKKSKDNNSIVMFQNKLPFPKMMLVKMNYSENQVITVGSAGVFGTELIFRLNDVFDPRFTSGGHQPLGRDQLTAIYGRFMTNACKIFIEFADPLDLDMITVAVVIQSSGNSFALTGNGIEYVTEKPNTWVKSISNSGQQRVAFNQYVDCQRLEGVSKNVWEANIDLYGAATGTSPTYSQYIRVACASPRSASTGSCIAKIKLCYYVKCYDQVTLPDS